MVVVYILLIILALTLIVYFITGDVPITALLLFGLVSAPVIIVFGMLYLIAELIDTIQQAIDRRRAKG